MEPHVNRQELREIGRQLRQRSEQIRRVADPQLHKSVELHLRWQQAEARFFEGLERCLPQEPSPYKFTITELEENSTYSLENSMNNGSEEQQEVDSQIQTTLLRLASEK